MSGRAERTLLAVDRAIRRALTAFCSALLVAMVVFTIYTVVMRTVFLAPPFWGDTLTLFANVWLVMLALAVAVRERSTISMEAFYVWLPVGAVRALRIFWTALYAAVGVLLAVWGYLAASRILGAFWELGNLPKSYPMMILPIAGLLVFAAAMAVLIEELRGSSQGPDAEDDRLQAPLGAHTTAEDER